MGVSQDSPTRTANRMATGIDIRLTIEYGPTTQPALMLMIFRYAVQAVYFSIANYIMSQQFITNRNNNFPMLFPHIAVASTSESHLRSRIFHFTGCHPVVTRHPFLFQVSQKHISKITP